MKTKSSQILNQATLDTVTKKVAGKTVVPKTPVLHRLIRDMTSEAYLSAQGTWSSTQLKTILDDEDEFIQKYVKKSLPKEEREAFDTGTYFHTGTLEPHKVAKEIAVYEGKTRFGKAWEEFKRASVGKTVITKGQKEQGDRLIKAVHASPISMEYLKGEPEISLFVELVVWGGNIYAPFYKKVLTPFGWEDFKGKIGDGFKVIMKVRADCLGENFISDLKSTSGSATKEYAVRGSISKYKYDLSAALYLDMFSLEKPDVSAFIWIFASKDVSISAAWVATRNQVMVGRAKWGRALKRLADLSSANWEIVDYLREAEPLPYELEWLQPRDKDLL